ncbi:hypothetical protein [Amycolatopsis viridis]|uniref:Serine/threonine protein kinase n=1 Tax=Amycolatopsis viridis TaxID=185678 RepID=A0ABX0STA9_9PSEU|nr:hypothetical protein [Amycolatopsis viridis]NIH80186.1 hypothetical protein [Amycolatopsis viridis]
MGVDAEPPDPGGGLTRGELVAGQYEVLNCFARGAFGLIHLARDRTLHRPDTLLEQQDRIRLGVSPQEWLSVPCGP